MDTDMLSIPVDDSSKALIVAALAEAFPSVEPVLTWCGECEKEYLDQAGEPCPLCPLWKAFEDARDTTGSLAPFHVVSDMSELRFQKAINDATALGWDLHTFQTGYSYSNETGEGDTVFVALLKQSVYPRGKHQQAVEAERRALAQFRGQRDAITEQVSAWNRREPAA